MRLLIGLLASFTISVSSEAAVGSKAGVGPVDNLSQAYLVRVKDGGRRYLYNGFGGGCPKLIAKCKRKGFVVPGDVLIATEVVGLFTSIEYVGRNGSSSDGYVETAGLDRLKRPLSQISSWVGTWRRDSEADIEIKLGRERGQLRAEGEARWGTGDPDRVKRGGVHTGSINGDFQPKGEWAGLLDADYDESIVRQVSQIDWENQFPYNKSDGSDCNVRFRLLGPYLLVYDDGDHCGGMNVSFTGVYRNL